MAEEEEPRAMSVAERIAALKLKSAGNIPVGQPGQQPPLRDSQPPNGTAPVTARPRPPPPPRPSVNARPNRNQTSSVPPPNDHAPTPITRPIGNQPEAAHTSSSSGTNGASVRPPLPSRLSSQAPALPARSPSGPSPALPPRRPSEAPFQPEYALSSRRGSTDSTSSVATTKSNYSSVSNATSFTSQGGERYAIRAPTYDPSSLPALPQKRTQEEKESDYKKYNARARPNALRRPSSTPKIQQIQQGTTPPPMPVRQHVDPVPALPSRTSSVSDLPKAVEAASPPARRQPPPPPVRREDPVLPTRPKRSALSMGFGVQPTSIPVQGANLDGSTSPSERPPPIPSTSKPDLAALQASKPKFNGAAAIPSATPSAPVAITSYAQFTHIISSHRIVVSDFYADWCGPCRNFAPDYDRLSKQYSRPSQVAFIKINTDHNKDIAQTYRIECWPTLIIFEDRTEVQKFLGANEHGLVDLVKKLARKARIDFSAPISAPEPAAAQMPAYASAPVCMHCRNFDAPDSHAARFPRQSLPSQDLGWLAQQLTAPFPSHTDKARAIFTWLHHNVAYNVQAFFGNNVKPSTPQSTLETGLAVCEGYAGLFTALAMKAGMESIVVGGHGKGYGHTPLAPGQPAPSENATGHAWNAVRIDGGEWKLLDACWGAGNVTPQQTYEKCFKPERFTQSNNDFGLDHFPEDKSKQFRTDGRIITWPEYILGNGDGCGADMYSGYIAEEGLSKASFRPREGAINLAQQGPTTRFSFQKICPHWDWRKSGKGPPFLFMLLISAVEGKDGQVPFETNGEVWWCDVPTRMLGRSGDKVGIYVLTKFGGSEGRGLTIEQFRRQHGRAGWSSGGVCSWTIA